MDELIDQSHFKSFKRLYPLIHEKYPEMTKKEIEEVIRKRLHDRRLRMNQKKPYMRQIFDPVIGCYFHDLLVQTNDKPKDYPKYFHVFLESNSRYAFAYPIEKKTAQTAIETLDKFLADNGNKPVVKLTSDGEGAFNSNEFTNYCSQKGIMVKIIPDKAHSSLGLIDRFIRTLRDMNQPQNRNDGYQYQKEYRNFSIPVMNEIINSYNTTVHKTIGCSPKEMYDNPAKEWEWIEKKKKFKLIQNNIEDFIIPPNTYVRYRMSNEDLQGRKRRSQFSREKYLVLKRVGSRYILKALDGTVITKSRFELIIADKEDPHGNTFEQNTRANPYQITSGILYT